MQELLLLAEHSGIIVEYWDFPEPLEAAYIKQPTCPPVIMLANRLKHDPRQLRTAIAHELGHHFTTAIGDLVPCEFYSYRDRIDTSKSEYRANRWAALHMMPLDKLWQAISQGARHCWELAEHFGVLESLVRLRMGLPDIQQLQSLRAV